MRAFFLMILLLMPVGLHAQYQVRQHTFSSSGGHIQNDGFSLTATAGQPFTGEVWDSHYGLGMGFWHTSAFYTPIEEPVADIPTRYSLEQNYPNPFNPSTTIRYSTPKNQHVTLSLYNALGQLVATLVDKAQPAGTYNVTLDAQNLTSGIYIYRLQAGAYQKSMKMMLIK